MVTRRGKRGKETKQEHIHHFTVPPPDGSTTLTAVCKECGFEKEVFATDAYWENKDWNRARDIKPKKKKKS